MKTADKYALVKILLLYAHTDINNNNTGRLCRFGYEQVY